MHIVIQFTTADFKISFLDRTEVGAGIQYIENNEVNTDDEWRFTRKFKVNLFFINLCYTKYYQHE